MKPEDLKIIDEFISGFEPWRSNLETMKAMRGMNEKSPACFICGIDPEKVFELKNAVEKLRNFSQSPKLHP